jgi:hypothetical protein
VGVGTPVSIPLGRRPPPAPPPPAAPVWGAAVALVPWPSASLEAPLALGCALVLGLLRLAVALSRRKPPAVSPAPAAAAWLQTRKPPAAGIDVGAPA